MVCDEVKRLVYFFLDGALGHSLRQRIESHLGACPACSRRVLIQRRLRTFVRHRLVICSAPDDLKIRLAEACRGRARVS